MENVIQNYPKRLLKLQIYLKFSYVAGKRFMIQDFFGFFSSYTAPNLEREELCFLLRELHGAALQDDNAQGLLVPL